MNALERSSGDKGGIHLKRVLPALSQLPASLLYPCHTLTQPAQAVRSDPDRLLAVSVAASDLNELSAAAVEVTIKLEDAFMLQETMHVKSSADQDHLAGGATDRESARRHALPATPLAFDRESGVELVEPHPPTVSRGSVLTTQLDATWSHDLTALSLGAGGATGREPVVSLVCTRLLPFP